MTAALEQCRDVAKTIGTPHQRAALPIDAAHTLGSYDSSPRRRPPNSTAECREFRVDLAPRSFTLAAQHTTRRLRIGMLEYAFAVLGPRFIDEFAQEQPGLLVEPIDAPHEQLAFALKSGALDLQFAAFAEQSRLPVRSGLRELTVITEPMALLVDESHRFAKRKRVTLAEAGKERLVLFERARSPEVYRATVQAFDELAIRPRIELEVGLLQTMGSAVRAIGGAGLVPACVRKILDAGLRVVPIDKDQSPRIRLSLIWSAKRDSEPVLALVDWVRRRKARESGVIDRQRSRRTDRSSLSIT